MSQRMPPNCGFSKNHGGRDRRRHAMRPEPDRLHDVADRAGLHQLARPDGRAVLEPLAVHDRVDAAGLGLHAPHLGQLLERRDARLVGHVVLAVLHHADADRRALVRNRRAQHQLDGRVLENLVLAARDLDCGNRFETPPPGPVLWRKPRPVPPRRAARRRPGC